MVAKINPEIHDAAQFFHAALKESGMVVPGQSSPGLRRLRFKNPAFDELLFHVDSGLDNTHLIRVCRNSKSPEQEGICLKFDAESKKVTALAQEKIFRNGNEMTVRGSNSSELGALGQEMLGALKYFRQHENKQDRAVAEVPSTSIEVRDEAVKLTSVGRGRQWRCLS